MITKVLVYKTMTTCDPITCELDKYSFVIAKYEIHPKFQEYLGLFENCVVAVIADDSGSMRTRDSKTGISRWDELKENLGILAEIYSITHPEGLTIHFLNRLAVNNLKSEADVNAVFSHPPGGVTPLTRTLITVVNQYQHVVNQGKKLILYIATDGEPTNDLGGRDIASFEAALAQTLLHPYRYCTIVACTDVEEDVAYMNGWDKKYNHCDVVDDYNSEKAEIQKVQGSHFKYSHGDHIIKTAFGSFVPELDNLDEIVQGEYTRTKQISNCGCVIM